MSLNFVTTEMTFLRYFIPMIIEGNKRGLSSRMLIKHTDKYSNPHKYESQLNDFAKQFDFSIHSIKEDFDGTYVLLEGSGLKFLPSGKPKITLTSFCDTVPLYEKYIDGMDHVIMVSEFFAHYYKKHSPKNLYLGSPKYDVHLVGMEVEEKYNLPVGPRALVLFPKARDLSKIDMRKIYSFLRRMGFSVIVKARGKDPATLKGDRYFEDFSWYPHDSMELMTLCDIVINFDSTAIKECVMLDVPMINFHIKPYDRLEFLYNYGYVKQLKPTVSFDGFSESIKSLMGQYLGDEFERARVNHLFEKGKNVSASILDEIGL